VSTPEYPGVPDPLWYDELRRSAATELRWLWTGYLAAGVVTLLTSRWKAGKTTLASVLLAKMAAGGELAGSAVAAGRAVVVSEESPAMWRRRGDRLGFGSHLAFLCRPFRGKPTTDEWLALVDRLADEHARHGLDLAVIDPLAAFLPGQGENHAGTMLAALAPLQRLTAVGLAVLLLHHPRKDSREALEPRGSGALPGFADVLAELDGPRPGCAGGRRRLLRAVSRFEETPAERLIELSPDGADYAVVTDVGSEEFIGGWVVLRTVMEDASGKLTRRDVLSQWPENHVKPSPQAVWTWLERAVAAGLVARDGAGRRNAPFRYWLPEREEELEAMELPPLDPLPPLAEALGLGRAKAAVRRMQEELQL
jgi:hypothetical protein